MNTDLPAEAPASIFMIRLPLPAFTVPGHHQRAEHEQEHGEGEEQGCLLDAGDDVVAVGAEAQPVAACGVPLGSDKSHIGNAPVTCPVDAAG